MDFRDLVTAALSEPDFNGLTRYLRDTELPQEVRDLVLTLVGITPHSMSEGLYYWQKYAYRHMSPENQEWAFRQIAAQRLLMCGADPEAVIGELMEIIQVCRKKGWDPEEFATNLRSTVEWSKQHFRYNVGLQSRVNMAEELLTKLEVKVGVEMDDIMNLPIEDLDLGDGTYIALKRAGKRTIRHLVESDLFDLMEIRNCGKRGLAEILRNLHRYGLTVRNRDASDEKSLPESDHSG